MSARRFFSRLLALAALLVAASYGATARAAPVAVVTDAQGRATLQGAAPGRPLAMLTEIEGDANVQLDDKARLVVMYYRTGDEYALSGPALVQFRQAAPEALSGSRPERRTAIGKAGNDVRIKPGGVTQAAVVMRKSEGQKLRLLGLSGTRTLEMQPEFRWAQLEPGVAYQFELSDDAGRVLYETKTSGTALKLPANVALKPDIAYTWEVSARLQSGLKYSSAGDFSLAGAELRAQAERMRPADAAPLSEQVAYALWLEQAELKDEARRIWRLARAQRPDDPRLTELAGD